MEPNNSTKTLPRIPDFFSMPKTLATYRLSQQGREATADLRRKFLSSKNDHLGGGISLRQSKADMTRKTQSSSAPSETRIKESSHRIGHGPPSHSRSRTRVSNEERARLRAKEYIAKQIYKIPTCQRPAFFVKVLVDPRSPFPYPQGTLTSSKCHFTYVNPTKSTDDKYAQLLEKSSNAKLNDSAKSLHVSRAEQDKRNRLVEELLSSTKPEISNASAVEATKDGPSNNVPTSTQPSPWKPGGQEMKVENGKEAHLNNLLTPQRSKTVGFCLEHNKHYKSIDTTGIGENGNNLLGRRQRNSQTNESRDSFTSRRGLSTADIASAHARHHFIHPEWPSEFISWARYSHPSTSEKFQYSFI